uniref:Uncharacterized protein n=1 Tax=Tetranychus urticae TaxID=32264 RepID=T1K396_TETUR
MQDSSSTQTATSNTEFNSLVQGPIETSREDIQDTGPNSSDTEVGPKIRRSQRARKAPQRYLP